MERVIKNIPTFHLTRNHVQSVIIICLWMQNKLKKTGLNSGFDDFMLKGNLCFLPNICFIDSRLNLTNSHLKKKL